MQFIPTDDTRPRRQARHLRAELAVRGIDLGQSACLDAVARLYGHGAWDALRRRIGRAKPSPLDDEADADSVAARRAVQEAALVAMGLTDAQARDVAESVRATARRYGRTALSAARVTFLDLPWTKLGPLPAGKDALMAEVLERERVMDVHRKGASSVGREALLTFLRSVPENVRTVAARFVDSPYEVTFGLLTFVGSLSRSHEEAEVWVATLQEIWRRLDGRVVRMGHFAEAFAHGVPTEAAVSETWSRRAAGERTTGMPRFDLVLPPGSVGLLVNGMRRRPYVAEVPAGGMDDFFDRHEAMFERAPVDPGVDLDAHLGLQVELLKENASMPDGHPELARSAGILLWLALVHPERGQAVRDAVEERTEAGLAAYVTLTVSDTLKVRTSVSDAFEDRARIMW